MIMTDEIKEIMAKLAEPLPSEGIQRTKSVQTKKGYDTDGYGYQFGVNRFNEVLGDKWGFNYEILNTKEGKYGSGGDRIDITASCHLWIITKDEEHTRSCVGGHTSRFYCDALKGAITNSFKKTAALWGVGRHAYEGALDDDNDPAKCAFEGGDTNQESNESKGSQSSQQRPPADQPKPQGKQGTIAGSNGNGDDTKTLTSKGIWIKFGKLKYSLEYKDLYKYYYLNKWKDEGICVSSMNELPQDKLRFLNNSLDNAINDKDYREQFRQHLDTFRSKPTQETISGNTKGITLESLHSMLDKIVDFPEDYKGKWEAYICNRYNLAAPWEMSTDEMIEQKNMIATALNSSEEANGFMRLIEDYDLAWMQQNFDQQQETSAIN